MINVRCCDLKCGVVFGMPDHVYEHARADAARWFYCPNGHQQHYDVDKVADLTADVQRKQEIIDRLSAEKARRDRTISYWKGIVSRLRRRK